MGEVLALRANGGQHVQSPCAERLSRRREDGELGGGGWDGQGSGVAALSQNLKGWKGK